MQPGSFYLGVFSLLPAQTLWLTGALYQCTFQFVTSEDSTLGFSWEVSSATDGTAGLRSGDLP